MKKELLIVICLGITYLQSDGQDACQPYPQKDSMTVEKALALPSTYTVKSCEIILNNKNLIFKSGYVKGMNFAEQWNKTYAQAKKDDNMSLENILVQKGDRVIKLMSKSCIVPPR